MKMASALSAAGLVHPASDETGDLDVVDWAARFVETHGVCPPSTQEATAHNEMVKASAYATARNRGWVLREERETRGASPADIAFKQQVAAVHEVQKLPPFVPWSFAHKALVNSVTTELQKRALHSLRMGGIHEKGVMSFQTDGPFEKLKMHGVVVASCSAGERDMSQWIAALESNLGIQVKPDASHQVLVVIDGKEITCDSSSVRVQIFNERLDGDEGRSMLFNFTSEGVITDCLRADGSLVATDASMYDDVVDALVESEPQAQRES
jgi:hypothetical protein